jgi:hypothetical protein
MSTTGLIIGIGVAIILLFVAFQFIKSCLPKIILVVIVLGVLAYLAYRYFTK